MFHREQEKGEESYWAHKRRDSSTRIAPEPPLSFHDPWKSLELPVAIIKVYASLYMQQEDSSIPSFPV